MSTGRRPEIGLTLRHIESYNLVSLTGSTLAAASRLGMSQSSVSRMLAQLEAYFDVALFERDKNRLVPTREGLQLGPRIRAIFDQMEAVRRAAEELKKGNSRDVLLRVAVPNSLTHGMMPRLLKSFFERYDQVRVEVEVGSYGDIERMVAEHRVEIGFTRVPFPTAGLQANGLLHSRSVCALRTDHPLAGSQSLSARDLRNQSLILLGRERAARVEIENAFFKIGHSTNPRIEAHTVGFACALAAEGLGIAIVNELMAQDYLGLPICFVPFEPAIVTTYTLITPERAPLSTIATIFLAHMDEVLRSRETLIGD